MAAYTYSVLVKVNHGQQTAWVINHGQQTAWVKMPSESDVQCNHVAEAVYGVGNVLIYTTVSDGNAK